MRTNNNAQAKPREERPPLQARAAAALGLSLVLLIGFGYVAQSITSGAGYPIRKVSVEGDFRFLTPTYIQTLVTRALKGGFFQIDVQSIHHQLLEEPWLYEATVERVWPDVIRVAIKEQVPAAQWGQNALLNADADIFAPNPSSIPNALPKLSGPVGSESEVLSAYHDISGQLAVLELEVATVALSSRGAWTVTLRGDTRLILGRDHISQRLDRFCTAFKPLLKAEWERIATVDLRFTNGFAVTERAQRKARLEIRING